VKTSVLDQIPGVGEKRREQLLKHFKSVKNIRAASPEQLAQVVPQNTAQAVYQHFHGKEN
jgi:excinuclease ABC subunit C